MWAGRPEPISFSTAMQNSATTSAHHPHPRPPNGHAFAATSPVALVLGLLFVGVIILVLGTTAQHGYRGRPPLGVQVVTVWTSVIAASTGLVFEMVNCHALLWCGSQYKFGESCLDAIGMTITCGALFTADGCSGGGRRTSLSAAAFYGAVTAFLLVKIVFVVCTGAQTPPEHNPHERNQHALEVRLRVATLGAAVVTTLLALGLTLLRRRDARLDAARGPRRLGAHFRHPCRTDCAGPVGPYARSRYARPALGSALAGAASALLPVCESTSELRYNSSAESIAPSIDISADGRSRTDSILLASGARTPPCDRGSPISGSPRSPYASPPRSPEMQRNTDRHAQHS